MALNLFLALVGYYVIKTVREPLILESGGAELKSYASALQAFVLMGLVPFYSWFSERVDRSKLIRGVVIFFVACIEVFYFAAKLDVPFVGLAFFVWVGIFSLAIIAQFWSYANDVYDEESGKRLFPVIAIGAAAGSMVGSRVAGWLFDLGISAHNMMQVTAGLLVAHLAIYLVLERRLVAGIGVPEPDTERGALSGGNGFTLVFKSRYLLLIGGVLVLANLVNTTGEYILSKMVVSKAEALAVADPTLEVGAWIGAFYGDYFFVVNVVTLVLQAFVVSRIVKFLGLRGVVLALPIVAMGTYAAAAAGVGFAAMRWAKTAENSTDYSVMNTAKAMLWLPTTREEKYKAKQAIDTFFVRFGDVMAAGLVFAGTTWLGFGLRGFAATNLVLILVWIALAMVLLKEYRRISAEREKASTSPEEGSPE
ncbi:MAG: translocase [Deltaproteobacteria bacterium]|nr:translocase [Deltaproteobacteria bacterium]